MRTNLPVTHVEVALRDDTLIVSKTDLKGQITYINRDFVEVSGFSAPELLGQPHNIVRHPDMPSEAYADMWRHLKAGRPWTGMVKNRCKNGDFYWVEANVTPMRENGQVVGYMSVRRKPLRDQVEAAEAAYRLFRENRAGSLRIRCGRVVPARSQWRERLTNLSLAARLGLGLGLALGLAVLVAWIGLQGAAGDGYADPVTAIVGAILAGMGTLGFFAWRLHGHISRTLDEARAAFEAVSQGRYDRQVDIAGNDDMGRLLQGLQSMQIRLGFDVAEAQRVANENLRIKIGLDNVATNVMVADDQHNIIYLNKAVQEMFSRVEDDIRRDLPDFRADRLLGANIDIFHQNPARQREMLSRLAASHRATVHLGGRTFSLIVTPVVNERGIRLGSAVEWLDRTAEVAVEAEVADIVIGAANGDFSHRLRLDDKEGFFRLLSEGINRLLETSQHGLEDVARMLNALSQGDLTSRIEAEYAGTFGQLKNDANSTVAQLTEIVERIKAASDAINTAAQEIASGNADLSSRTEEQASSLEETASSMEQLTGTVKLNAENARTANGLANDAQQVAVKGGEVVAEVVKTMGAIHRASSRISDIIGVIDGIAFQTNILALNAAVEAARAGEQGRGFAVVATEVRNLAQRSAAAAKEIKGLISDSVEKVENGTKLVDVAGRTMEEVVAAIQDVAKIMSDIAAASGEQSAGIEQVGLAVSQMDEVTQQNAALVEQAAAAAASLEEQAHGLWEAVSVFHLKDEAPAAVGGTPPQVPPPRFSHKRRGVPPQWYRSSGHLAHGADDGWEAF